jgi:hypothetical protein
MTNAPDQIAVYHSGKDSGGVIVQIGPPATHFDQYTRTDLYTAALARAEKAEAERDALRARVNELRTAMQFGCGCAINDLNDESGSIPEWNKGSGIAVMLAALGCHENRLNEIVRQALKGTPND